MNIPRPEHPKPERSPLRSSFWKSTSGNLHVETGIFDVHDYEQDPAVFRGLCEAILENPYMIGFCYTQLTDVEQEQNGLYTYDRKPKFDPEWVKSVLSGVVAVEGGRKEE